MQKEIDNAAKLLGTAVSRATTTETAAAGPPPQLESNSPPLQVASSPFVSKESTITPHYGAHWSFHFNIHTPIAAYHSMIAHDSNVSNTPVAMADDDDFSASFGTRAGARDNNTACNVAADWAFPTSVITHAIFLRSLISLAQFRSTPIQSIGMSTVVGNVTITQDPCAFCESSFTLHAFFPQIVDALATLTRNKQQQLTDTAGHGRDAQGATTTAAAASESQQTFNAAQWFYSGCEVFVVRVLETANEMLLPPRTERNLLPQSFLTSSAARVAPLTDMLRALLKNTAPFDTTAAGKVLLWIQLLTAENSSKNEALNAITVADAQHITKSAGGDASAPGRAMQDGYAAAAASAAVFGGDVCLTATGCLPDDIVRSLGRTPPSNTKLRMTQRSHRVPFAYALAPRCACCSRGSSLVHVPAEVAVQSTTAAAQRSNANASSAAASASADEELFYEKLVPELPHFLPLLQSMQSAVAVGIRTGILNHNKTALAASTKSGPNSAALAVYARCCDVKSVLWGQLAAQLTGDAMGAFADPGDQWWEPWSRAPAPGLCAPLPPFAAEQQHALAASIAQQTQSSFCGGGGDGSGDAQHALSASSRGAALTPACGARAASLAATTAALTATAAGHASRCADNSSERKQWQRMIDALLARGARVIAELNFRATAHTTATLPPHALRADASQAARLMFPARDALTVGAHVWADAVRAAWTVADGAWVPNVSALLHAVVSTGAAVPLTAPRLAVCESEPVVATGVRTSHCDTDAASIMLINGRVVSDSTAARDRNASSGRLHDGDNSRAPSSTAVADFYADNAERRAAACVSVLHESTDFHSLLPTAPLFFATAIAQAVAMVSAIARLVRVAAPENWLHPSRIHSRDGASARATDSDGIAVVESRMHLVLEVFKRPLFRQLTNLLGLARDCATSPLALPPVQDASGHEEHAQFVRQRQRFELENFYTRSLYIPIVEALSTWLPCAFSFDTSVSTDRKSVV